MLPALYMNTQRPSILFYCISCFQKNYSNYFIFYAGIIKIIKTICIQYVYRTNWSEKPFEVEKIYHTPCDNQPTLILCFFYFQYIDCVYEKNPLISFFNQKIIKS